MTLPDRQVFKSGEVAAFRSTRVLTPPMIDLIYFAVRNNEDGATEIQEAVERLCERVKAFRDQVWLPWLKRDFAALPTANAEANSPTVDMQMLSSAGRIMVALRPTGGAEDAEFVSLLGYTGNEKEEQRLMLRSGFGDYLLLEKILSDAVESSASLQTSLRSERAIGWGIA